MAWYAVLGVRDPKEPGRKGEREPTAGLAARLDGKARVGLAGDADEQRVAGRRALGRQVSELPVGRQAPVAVGATDEGPA